MDCTSSSCGLKILNWNCNGLSPKINEFKQYTANNQNSYDIICLQETFLKPDKNFTLDGYSIVRQDRTDSAKGGLLTLVKTTLNYIVLDSGGEIECILVGIKLKDNNYIKIANLYIPPLKVFTARDISFLFTSKTIIVGDLNSKNTLWGSPITDSRGDIVEQLINDNNFIVLNNTQPTYTHYNGTRSHLDLTIACSTIASKTTWEVLNNAMGSDHAPTLTYFNDLAVFVENTCTTKFKLSKADWNSFKNNCRNLVTTDLLDSESVDTITERITSAVLDAAQCSIPVYKAGKNRRVKPLPYWNDNCKTAVKDRNRARNAMHKNKTIDNCIKYRRLKARAQHVIRSTARQHWEDYCSTLDKSTKLGAVWRMAKKMNGVNNEHRISNLSVDGNTVDTNTEKAEVFAKTFTDTSSNTNYSSTFLAHKQNIETNHSELFENTSDTTDNTKIRDLNEPFELHELRRAIRDSKKHSSPGDDNISYEMLQKLPKNSVKTLLALYNKIWKGNDFPVSWRHSIVLPILKTGKNPQSAASYRPISLTSTLCKIMEKLVATRLAYFVEKHNILNNVQSGFRKGRSTVDHIIRLQDTINKYNHNKGFTVGVFIDFESAFPMLWRNGLLIKLKKYGITGNIFTFISNFLANRTLQVKVGSSLSNTYTLDNGTAQGSMISPLLFLLMINDLPDTLHDVETSLFADDSCIFKSGKNLKHIVNSIQQNLLEISKWCDLWGFKINTSKTVAVVFTHRSCEQIKLTLHNKELQVDKKAKFLGLIFDSKLTWSEHIKYIEDKCKKRINLMRAVAGNQWGASKKTLLTIYRVLIRSVIDYGSIAYNSATDNVKRRLDVIQHRALRIACGAFCGTASAALQVETGEPPLAVRRKEQELKYAVKVKATPDHPAKATTEFHWTTLSKRFTSNNLPLYNKTLEYFTQSEVDNVNSPKIPDDPPWHLKPCLVDTSLTGNGRKDENPLLLKNKALATIDTYSDTVNIYTDASKTLENKTAAAYCVPTVNVKHCARLNNNITIFAAELTALKLAVLWVINTLQENVTIFSDSLSCLQALSSGKSSCRPNLLLEVQHLVSTYTGNITFVWIPSHVGITGNELADRLANSATLHAEIELDIGFELSEAYQAVTVYNIQQWQVQWDTDTTGRHYNQIESTVSTRVKYSNKCRRTEVTITRLRLGKCKLNYYMHKINKHPTGLCSICNKDETVTHFLLECAASSTCRAVLLACSSLGVTPTLRNVLTDSRLHSVIISSLTRNI